MFEYLVKEHYSIEQTEELVDFFSCGAIVDALKKKLDLDIVISQYFDGRCRYEILRLI